ncbi:MAG: PriCT-2 domain-containing protein [Tabrizicola sp.]|nr:PriCT-2 domain-containing protein [Tabrizicola sp.]
MTIIEQIVALGHRERHTRYFAANGEAGYTPVDGPITADALQAHLSGGQALGMYLCADPDREKSHFLVLDFDDKSGEGIAKTPTIDVALHLEELGLPFLLFRSGGGNGYHIWLAFGNARRVDKLKEDAKRLLDGVKVENTKFVPVASGSLNKKQFNAKGQVISIEHGVEVLPKGFGWQNVAIPCGRKSVPMRLVRSGTMVDLEECSVEDLDLRFVPMQKPGKKKAEQSPDVDRDAAFDAFIKRFSADDRAQWGAAGICLQVAFGKENDWARDRWVEWSKSSSAYRHGDEDEWNQLSGAKNYSPLSFWYIAKENGYSGKWPFTQSERRKLLALDFLTDVKILRDQSDKAYAELRERDFVQIDSNEFKETVALALYRKEQNLPDERAVKGAQMIAMAMARDTEPEEIALRFAKVGGKRYVFLADKERTIVEIDEEGWRVNNAAPVQFRKGVGLPMAVERGGSLDELLAFFNVDQDSMIFLLAWMATTIIHPGGQCPIAILDGIAGSGKSSTLSTIVQIVDPKVGAQAGDPQSEEDLVVSAYQSAVLSFDNVTSLSKFSDALCRMATGGGMSRRKKYSDGDVFALDAMRPVLVAGVDPTFYKQDLIERIIRITLTKPTAYIDEEEFLSRRRAMLPKYRGVLFDLVSRVMRDVHGIEQTTARFGVFTRVGESVARLMGRPDGWFMSHYELMRMSIALESGEADSVYQFLVHHLKGFDKGVGSVYRDTAGRLLMELRDTLKEAPIPISMADVPSNARVMGSRIPECVSLLAKSTGWVVTRGRDREFIFQKQREVEASADDVFEMAKVYAESRDRSAGIA